MRSLVAAVVALLLGTGSAGAQQSWAIPQSPAFTFLDVSPTRIERPSTARDFAAAIQNGIDEEGRVVQGFALEAAPWTWLPGVSIPVARYAERGSYMLANLSLSLATTRSVGDTASTNIALGFRTTVFDDSDPMTDPRFVHALRDALVACDEAFDGEAPDELVRLCAVRRSSEATPGMAERALECRQPFHRTRRRCAPARIPVRYY